MKLLLTSTGFQNTAITDAFTSLVGKPAHEISIAVINEAYAVELSDHSWVIDELQTIRQTVGGAVELIDLLANEPDAILARLRQHDAIYVIGGHTDYLMSVFNKSGLAAALPELLKTKVYVGSSAGSMVICNRVSTEAYQRLFNESKDYGVTEYMGLVDVAIKPHLGSPLFPNSREDVLVEIAQQYPGTIYGLADSAALLVDGDTQRVVGHGYVKIQRGETQGKDI